MSPVKYVLYFYIGTSRSMCAVHNMAVFCISLISCFPDMLLRYCLSDFEMVPFAPIITGILLLLLLLLLLLVVVVVVVAVVVVVVVIVVVVPVPMAARSKALVCSRSPAEIVGSNLTGGMDVCLLCYVLSGRGLCDELITRPEKSYRLWCVVVCDVENLKNEEAITSVGSQSHRKKSSSSSSSKYNLRCTSGRRYL